MDSLVTLKELLHAPVVKPKGKIRIFDTTLRDGDQSFGNGFLPEEKKAVACALVDMGVDVMEIGFGRSRSDNGMESIIEVVMDNFPMEKLPVFASLGRLVKEDIDEAYNAIVRAPREKRRIHIFTSGSDEHIQSKFGEKMQFENKEAGRAWVISETNKWVAYAVSKDVAEVEFSMEDAPYADLDFLLELVRTAIQSGAKILNIPDTVGRSSYQYMRDLIRYLIVGTEDLGVNGVDFYFSSHSHNDLANALETSLGAVDGGALQVEGTINGTGERYGNTNLCNFIGRMAEIYGPEYMNVDITKLHRCSAIVYGILGNRKLEARPFIDPVRHGAGIHTDGVRKGRKILGKDIYSPYSQNFGTPSFRPVFSPRGGAGDVCSIIYEYCGEKFSKTDPVIEKTTFVCAKQATMSRWLEGVNVYALWLEQNNHFSFSPENMHIYNNSIDVTISLYGNDIRLSNKGISNTSTGYISSLVSAINAFLGENIVDIASQESDMRTPISEQLRNMGYVFRGFDSPHEGGAQSVGIAVYEISSLHHGIIHSRCASANMNYAIIRSIIEAVLPDILRKIAPTPSRDVPETVYL